MASTETRTVTIYFNDSSQLAFTMPVQATETNVGSLLTEFGAMNMLMVELEGKLVLIPYSSIHHFEVSPAPDRLPKTVLRGAKLVR